MRYLIIIFLFLSSLLFSQVEHVHIYHPVYDLLLRFESKGYMPYGSLSDLPLQRKQVMEILENVPKNELSKSEIKTLDKYLKEFELIEHENRVLVPSSSDSSNVLFTPLFLGNQEKFFYKSRGRDQLSIKPLGNAQVRTFSGDSSQVATLANAGVRLYGTIDSSVGYQLQVTNGAILSGNRDLLLNDERLSQNVKFTVYDSDFDFTESHVRFDYDWFYAYIGRESRLIGAGLDQRLILSDAPPAIDAFSLGARFKTFEYKYSHFSLISNPLGGQTTGIASDFIEKYMAYHRAAFRQKWGEIAIWEQVIYTNRGWDVAYLNPLSFLKTVEHSLRDRDNSVMGFDFTIRPFKNLQFKGTYLLDDIIFSEIGNNFWSNKTAYNFGVISSLPLGIDLGAEYARNEPYVFSHFDNQQALTNDGVVFAGYTPPNSDRLSLQLRKWYGNRFPLKLDISYLRHGQNVFVADTLFRNVGGDAEQTRRFGDSERVSFLDGNLVETLSADFDFTFEIVRGFNLQLLYTLRKQTGSELNHIARVGIRFDEF